MSVLVAPDQCTHLLWSVLPRRCPRNRRDEPKTLNRTPAAKRLRPSPVILGPSAIRSPPHTEVVVDRVTKLLLAAQVALGLSEPTPFEGRPRRTFDLSGCSTTTDATNAVIEKLARPYHTPGTSR